mgnify:CR=1 FL=1
MATAAWAARRRINSSSPSLKDGEYRLTDSVHRLIHQGLQVDCYQIYDQDEIQGINTRPDLEQAGFILLKRSFRPRREQERNVVRFGTGGWRAVIGEGFSPTLLVKDANGLAVDSESIAYADRIIFLKDGKLVDETRLSQNGSESARVVKEKADALA